MQVKPIKTIHPELKILVVIIITLLIGFVLNAYIKNIFISLTVTFIGASLLLMSFSIEVRSGIWGFALLIFILVGGGSAFFGKPLEGIFVASLLVYLLIIFLSMKPR